MDSSYIAPKNAAATAGNQAALARQKARTEYETSMANALHYLSQAVEGLIELQGNEAEARSKPAQ